MRRRGGVIGSWWSSLRRSEKKQEEDEEDEEDEEEGDALVLCMLYYAMKKRDRERQALLPQTRARPLKSPRHPAPRFVWDKHVAYLRRSEGTGSWGHDAFRKRYRMTQLAFNNLLNLLAPRLRKNNTMSGVARGGHPIVLEVSEDVAPCTPPTL